MKTATNKRGLLGPSGKRKGETLKIAFTAEDLKKWGFPQAPGVTPDELDTREEVEPTFAGYAVDSLELVIRYRTR